MKNKFLQLATLISALWLYSTHASAGLLIQRPLYIGLDQGLVGHWTFDAQDMSGERAYDRSGNNNTGILTNGPARVSGKLGQALRFDGTTGIGIDNSANLGESSQITLSAWVKPGSFVHGANVIIGKAQVSPGNSWRLYIDNTKTLELEIFNNSSTLAFVISNSTHLFDDLGWHHVVAKYDGSTTYLYVDGVDVSSGASRSLTGSIFDSTIPVCIATQSNGSDCTVDTSRSFIGSIDDVRIYNRALTADEIKRLYNMGR